MEEFLKIKQIELLELHIFYKYHLMLEKMVAMFKLNVNLVHLLLMEYMIFQMEHHNEHIYNFLHFLIFK